MLNQIAVDTSNMTEISYSFLATDLIRVADPKLEETEDIEVVLLSEEQVKQALNRGDVISALMVAPLWQYFYKKQIELNAK